MIFLFNVKSILSYLFLFYYLLKSIICNNNEITDIECIDYLKTFEIICTNITKTSNGKNICNNWYDKNTSNIIYIPDKCKNKNYELNLLYDNLNKTTRIKGIININKNFIVNLKEIKNNVYINKKAEINRCLVDYSKFQEKCLIYSNSEILNLECAKLKKNLNISLSCTKLVLSTIDNSEKKIKSLIQKNDNILLPIKNKEKFTYFDLDENNDQNIKFIEQENDIELKNNGKDCVEYGLKSIDNDIIVCLKYE